MQFHDICYTRQYLPNLFFEMNDTPFAKLALVLIKSGKYCVSCHCLIIMARVSSNEISCLQLPHSPHSQSKGTRKV
jgi:hypothetical protein